VQALDELIRTKRIPDPLERSDKATFLTKLSKISKIKILVIVNSWQDYFEFQATVFCNFV